ncbi:hypothetical protein PHJA_001864400 [Phtheirospermum japonicum]|uniref:Uncharacterized protein n=1 Tax=Phtheirospermum japonicum TaxID=374723 RepID=A0A830CMY6_9LAMI|nr:hypothetical protein PHJA_001864400 [Phtheirospermum japonicum]
MVYKSVEIFERRWIGGSDGGLHSCGGGGGGRRGINRGGWIRIGVDFRAVVGKVRSHRLAAEAEVGLGAPLFLQSPSDELNCRQATYCNLVPDSQNVDYVSRCINIFTLLGKRGDETAEGLSEQSHSEHVS